MATTVFTDYFTALLTKLANSSYVTNTDYITFGETYDLAGKEDAAFPRLEILITKLKGNGYSSQRNMEWSLRYTIMGWMRTATDAEYPTITEVNNITSFAKETLDLNYQFLDDKQGGNSPCSGFIMMGDFPEVFIEKEIVPKTIGFLVDLEAHVLISDTEGLS